MEVRAPEAFRASPLNSGRQWLASRLLQKQVVNTSTVELVGSVADVAFDPESCQLTGLMIQPTAPGHGLMAAVRRVFGANRVIGLVGLDHIIALHEDMVTIDTDPVVSALPVRTRASQLRKVQSHTIITTHGVSLGSLVDVLLDERGSRVTGYVIDPTRKGEALLRPYEESEQRLPLRIASDTNSDDAAAESKPLPAHLRVIPASPRVHIGRSLILVVEEVEPLRPQPIVITTQ
jgi:sporulation protein YlmC with PRC-barrel domain